MPIPSGPFDGSAAPQRVLVRGEAYCTLCDRWVRDCGHTDAERKKHEEDQAWEDHKEFDPEVED